MRSLPRFATLALGALLLVPCPAPLAAEDAPTAPPAPAAAPTATAPATAAAAPAIEFRDWYQGDPDMRLIRKEEGVCALTRVTGHFEGDGEEVRVYVADDGYWYLGGNSAQDNVAAQCVVVRFQPAVPGSDGPAEATRPASGSQPAGKPVSVLPTLSTAETDLVVLSATYGHGSQFADVTGRINTLLHEPGRLFKANPEFLQRDPAAGWRKVLVVTYLYEGRRTVFATDEFTDVSRRGLAERASIEEEDERARRENESVGVRPTPPPALAIDSPAAAPARPAAPATPASSVPDTEVILLSATYGAGYQFVDVTSRVNALLRAPKSTFRATPDLLGTTATDGEDKVLLITYLCGEKRVVFAADAAAECGRTRLAAYADEQAVGSARLPSNVHGGAGELVDPGGDCRLQRSAGGAVLTLPGGVVHDLFPPGALTAPRLLFTAEGDFMATVRVSGEFDPGQQAAGDYARSYRGAGLVVWLDEKNFVRLERGEMVRVSSGEHVYMPPLVQQCLDGEYHEGLGPDWSTQPVFAEAATSLRLLRQGSRMQAFVSGDNGAHWNRVAEFDTFAARGVRVGLDALNTSAGEFVARFDDFSLTPLTTE